MLSAVTDFINAVKTDYGSVQRYRKKYHGEDISLMQLPANAVRKIGFQMLLGVRGMHLVRDMNLPLAPQVFSRMLRHLYGVEIHWDAKIAPGISVVHGNGLVISHGAQVDEGCILFHNVTLGEGIDPETREVGAPHLCEDVHVGPGATLIGPIVLGAGTKVMAGAVLDRSVPPNSIVRSGDARVETRKKKRTSRAGK